MIYSDKINLLILIVNFLILIVYALMAKYMYSTFTGGQKQTEISLSINQFNIYHFELQGLIGEGKNIKFRSDLNEGILKTLDYQFINSNGIEYISVFTIATDTLKYTLNKNNENSQVVINDFRNNVLFPLSRYYDKLFHFLNRVKADKVLNQDYRNILYNYIERDVLQTYFRVCNNCFQDFMTVDLLPFKTIKYDTETFYKINKFYIENKIFQYKDLQFYKDTF